MTRNNSDVMFDLDTMARVIQALTAAKKEIAELTTINEKLKKQLDEKATARQTPSFIGHWIVSNSVVTYGRLVKSF